MTSALTGHVKVGGTYPLYITGTTTLLATEHDRVISSQGGAATLNLPSLATCFNGYEISVRNNGGGVLTATAFAGDAIGAGTTQAIAISKTVNFLVDHVRNKWQVSFGPS